MPVLMGVRHGFTKHRTPDWSGQRASLHHLVYATELCHWTGLYRSDPRKATDEELEHLILDVFALQKKSDGDIERAKVILRQRDAEAAARKEFEEELVKAEERIKMKEGSDDAGH